MYVLVTHFATNTTVSGKNITILLFKILEFKS